MPPIMRWSAGLPGALLAAVGCAAEPAALAPPPLADAPGVRSGGNITHLVGSLLLHEFPAGGHGSLTIVEKPISLADLDGREPFTLPYVAAVREGPCQLYPKPRCSPSCPSDSQCTAPQRCTPIETLFNIDIGEVQVRGSSTAPLIRLWFVGPQYTYAVDPAPGTAKLYAGGERLHVSGGTGAYALDAIWPAPAPVVVHEPPAQQPLHLPVAGPFTLRWEPTGGGLMVIFLIASTTAGDWAQIRCLVPDSGEFTVPASLVSALPPPPRAVRYELERDEEVLVPLPLGPGVGMLVHAAFTAWQNGTDPK